jgi:hypothetical protein
VAFPIVLANGPSADRLQEVSDAGVTMVRTGIANWSEPQLAAQIEAERAKLDAAHAAGLQCWVWLGTLTNLPAGAPSPAERMLTQVVEALRGHPSVPGKATTSRAIRSTRRCPFRRRTSRAVIAR